MQDSLRLPQNLILLDIFRAFLHHKPKNEGVKLKGTKRHCTEIKQKSKYTVKLGAVYKNFVIFPDQRHKPFHNYAAGSN